MNFKDWLKLKSGLSLSKDDDILLRLRSNKKPSFLVLKQEVISHINNIKNTLENMKMDFDKKIELHHKIDEFEKMLLSSKESYEAA